MKTRLISTFVLTVLFLVCSPSARAAGQKLSGHVPEAAKHLQALDRVPSGQVMNLDIALPLRDPQGLANLLTDIYDPASPNFHHYLTPGQFAERFGPSQADYDALCAFATNHHLEITTRHPNRMLLDVRGSAADVENALHLTLGVYQHPTEQRRFYAPQSEPSLDLTVPVLHVGGLDNYSLPQPRFKTLSASSASQAAAPQVGSGPSGAYMGGDFRAAYAPGVTLNGAGQSVGLLQFDGYTASDIAYYESQAGLPSVTLSNVLLDGFGGFPSGGNGQVEVSLDIEMAISMAPGLSQVFVYMAGPHGNWHDILNRMATDNLAKQLSCSWYIPNGGPDPVADQIWQQMAAQGQSFFNASGDYDAYTGPIDFPGDSPYITQVGGTTLTTTGSGGAWVSEKAWNWGNGVGTGGGVSTSYSIPNWQAPVSMGANLGSTTMRNTPDVALTGDNVYVRAAGYDHIVGGTSCAAPLWGGFAALINQQAAIYGKPALGFANPPIYALGLGAGYAAAFRDVTNGNNFSASSPAKFPAVAGYDLATGWGTPNGQHLIDALVPPDSLIVNPGAGFASIGAVGGPFTVSMQTFALTNTSASNVNWSLGNTSNWLSASVLGGSITAGGNSSVTVGLNNAASNLPPAFYTAHILITNQNNGFIHDLPFTLQVHDPLLVTPASGFDAAGPVGGPFTTNTEVFSLTNSGLTAVNWSLNNTSLWLTASSAAGILAPQTAATATIGLNTIASNLPPAGYSGTVVFSNVNSGLALNRQFTLRTGQLSLQNNGFELGSFAHWSLTGNTIYSSVTSDLTYVHSGNYGARLAAPGTPGFISQTVATTPGQGYTISFWLENPSGASANDFQVTWNGSVVLDLPNLGVTGWTNIQVPVGAVSISAVLTFGFANSFYFGLDDVGVFRDLTVTNPPAITRQPTNVVAAAGWTVSFNAGVSGTQPFLYQWLFNGTNLAGATNSTLILSPVNSSQAGLYSLAVTNAFGSALSSNATLTVTSPVCDSTPSGLVSWWRAEGDGLDSVGGNDGTLQGGISFGAGEAGQDFIMNGTDGQVLVPDSPSLHLTNQITIEAWINTRSTNQDRSILAKIGGAGGNNGYQMGLEQNTLFGQFNTNGQGWPGFRVAVPLPIPTNAWCHVAWTYDQSAMTLYFNGAPVATNVIGPAIINTSSSNLRIGADDNGTTHFDGQIDEVSLYSRALSPAEVAAIYNAGSAGKCFTPLPPTITQQPLNSTVIAGQTATFMVNASGSPRLTFQWLFNTNNLPGATNATLVLNPVTAAQAGNYSVIVSNRYGTAVSSNAVLTIVPATCDPAPSGLVSWWRAEGDGSDNVSVNNGTLEGGTSFMTGEVGQCFNFNGIDGDVVVPDSPTLRLNSQVTIEAWLNTRSTNQDQSVVSKIGGGGGNNGYQMGLVQNTLYAQFNSPGQGWPGFRIAVRVPIPTNVWCHVAWTYDQSAMKLYFNGLPVATNTIGPATINASGSNLHIGSDDNGTTHFNGQIDEASLYNRALSASEIAALYAANAAGKCVTPTPPTIVQQPASQSIAVGATATFIVAASGASPLRYQWLFNGTTLPGATNFSLVINNAQFTNAGVYAVVVTNLYGSALSSNATLTVNPQNCDPPPSGLVSWWRAEGNATDSFGTNNGTLQGGASYGAGEVGQDFSLNGSDGQVLVPNSASLRITNQITIEAWINTRSTNQDRSIVAKVGGAGGNNGYQMGLSHSSLFAQFNTPGSFLWPQFSISVPLPIVTNTWCHVAWTYDQSAMKLYYNGLLLASNYIGSQTINSSASNLRIGADDNNTTHFDGQIDEVSLYNRALSSAEIAAIFAAAAAGKCDAHLPPAIVRQPLSQIVLGGSNATFSVAASGMPPLAYQWYFNSNTVAGATNASLTVSNAQSANAGFYGVIVTDVGGATPSSNAQLTVVFPPRITSQPRGESLMPGCSAFFNPVVTGTPPMNFQWSKDGQPLNGQTNSVLVLLSVQPGDFGVYSLTVSNAYGVAASSNAPLVLNHPPLAGSAVIQRYANGGVRVNVGQILASDSDPDGNPLNIVGVSFSSAAGGQVNLVGTSLFYQPPAGFTNSDSFGYTVSDGHCGGTAVGTVTVQINPDNTANSAMTIQPLGDGVFRLILDGIPAYAYRVQYAGDLVSSNWQDLVTLTNDQFGTASWTNQMSTNAPARYYRAVWP